MISDRDTQPPKRIDIQVVGGKKSLEEQLAQFPGLIDHWRGEDVLFIERNYPILLDEVEIYLSHNLIRTTSTTPGKTRFYVIASKADGDVDEDNERLMYGKGSFSRVRKITHSVEITKSRQIEVRKVQGKAARIKNTQEAELNRYNAETGDYNKYDHAEAIAEYEIAKNFPYLGMEPPVLVVKDKSAHPNENLRYEFEKSYSVMNAFDRAGEINVVFDPKHYGAMTIKEVLELMMIPVLKAYKEQVAGVGFVHRDIKPGNILLELGVYGANADKPPVDPSVVTFVDVDMSAEIGAQEIQKGAAAFMPPEVTIQNAESIIGCKTTQARDIFALGMVWIATINPDLDPVHYFKDAGVYKNNQDIPIITPRDINAKWENLLISLGCWYNPDVLLKRANEAGSKEIKYDAKLGLFTYLKGSDIEDHPEVREQVLNILKLMTNVHPGKRPSIDELIVQCEQVLANLPSRIKMVDKPADMLGSGGFSLFEKEGRLSPNARRKSHSPKKGDKENAVVTPKNLSPKKENTAVSPRKTSPERENKERNTSVRRQLAFPEPDDSPANIFKKSPRK